MTSTTSILHDIPGGRALFDWFERVPGFHDAELVEASFSGRGEGMLRIHTWNMTDRVDAEGYFIPDRHAVVTLALEGVCAINCDDFDRMPGIIFDLEITKPEEHFRIEWTASHGVNGFVTARAMRIGLEPGKPDRKFQSA